MTGIENLETQMLAKKVRWAASGHGKEGGENIVAKVRSGNRAEVDDRGGSKLSRVEVVEEWMKTGSRRTTPVGAGEVVTQQQPLPRTCGNSFLFFTTAGGKRFGTQYKGV